MVHGWDSEGPHAPEILFKFHAFFFLDRGSMFPPSPMHFNIRFLKESLSLDDQLSPSIL